MTEVKRKATEYEIKNVLLNTEANEETKVHFFAEVTESGKITFSDASFDTDFYFVKSKPEMIMAMAQAMFDFANAIKKSVDAKQAK